MNIVTLHENGQIGINIAGLLAYMKTRPDLTLYEVEEYIIWLVVEKLGCAFTALWNETIDYRAGNK